ncbi:MAG: hypothetical protein ACR2NZ_08000, partial [Rubripirellula sp.]
LEILRRMDSITREFGQTLTFHRTLMADTYLRFPKKRFVTVYPVSFRNRSSRLPKTGLNPPIQHEQTATPMKEVVVRRGSLF